MTESNSEDWTNVSVRPETRRNLRILKAKREVSTYDEIIREELNLK